MKDLKLQRKGNNFVESTLITMVENLGLFGVQMRHFGSISILVKNLIFFREKEGRKLDKINLMKKMNKVTKGASMATKVYEDALQTALNEASKKGRRGGVDRLKKDKRYLHSLSRQLTKRTDIPDDTVHDDVIAEAQGVLSFLKQRDMFWDQLQY